MGWKIADEGPIDIKKYIIIGAPHTSWVDFLLGALIKYSTRVEINFIAKHTLFKPPVGFFFRALGGTPVDRSKSKNLVEAIINIFDENEKFILALAPEGTRNKVSKWKTGFYYVAQGAGVPIVMHGFDFKNKKYIISKPYTLTGNMEIDFKHFYNFYKDIEGKYPELFNPDFYKNIT